MKFLLAATFKSNKTISEIKSWLKEVAPHTSSSRADLALALPFPYLHLFSENLPTSSQLMLAAQNVSPFPPGSYTGEVNVTQLKDSGVEYCIIGHSERRHYFHETHVEVGNKAKLLIDSGITPILCLRREDVVPQLAALSSSDLKNILFCYEPPGDIGGTTTAPLEEIKNVLAHVQQEAGENVSVMYGGSVNANNLDELLSLDMDGVLISTASLEATSFIEIINKYNSHFK